MNQPTQGPWRAEFGENSGYDCMTGAWTIYAGHRTMVADIDQCHYGQDACDTDYRSPEAEANARLIAAAPDLLEALKELERTTNVLMGDHYDALVAARAAIAKAEGSD